jgi:hypothetical protein
MKKTIFKFFGIAAISSAMFFTSCSGDDDGGEQPGDSNTLTWEEALNASQTAPIQNKTVTLTAGSYELSGKLVIGEGSVLTIPAGTTITATSANAYVAIAQGGKIDAQGTAANPIVFTSNPSIWLPNTQGQGSWGGLVICGKAPINKAPTATSEVADLTYGGTDSNDNSGILKYIRIEYAGKIITGEKEFNGVTFFGVGAGTSVSYIQAYHGSDDGFEFFGGTVNTDHMVSSGNEDDQFDWTEGWNGNNSYWYGKEGFSSGNRGMECDNLEANFDVTPISEPTVSNLTLIGLGNQGAEPQGLKLRHGTKAHFSNVVLSNWATGIDIQHDQSLSFIPSGLFIQGVKFINVGTDAKGTNTAGEDVDVSNAYSVDNNATGAGNGTTLPGWAQGWTNTSGL